MIYNKISYIYHINIKNYIQKSGFDSGSEWTLAICLTHASCTGSLKLLVANGRIICKKIAFKFK